MLIAFSDFEYDGNRFIAYKEGFKLVKRYFYNDRLPIQRKVGIY